jgi:hypothetical protein
VEFRRTDPEKTSVRLNPSSKNPPILAEVHGKNGGWDRRIKHGSGKLPDRFQSIPPVFHSFPTVGLVENLSKPLFSPKIAAVV